MIRWLLDGPLKGFPDLPPLWLLGFLAAAKLLATALPLTTAFGLVMRGLGLWLIAVALILILWSAWWFWRKKTTIEPHHPPTALIIEGPYQFSRNPIYLGLLALLTGYVLWLGALSPILLPYLFYEVLTRRFILPEEEGLRRLFGAEAHAYLEATRRWL